MRTQAEVRGRLRDFPGAVAAYERAQAELPDEDFNLLQGLAFATRLVISVSQSSARYCRLAVPLVLSMRPFSSKSYLKGSSRNILHACLLLYSPPSIISSSLAVVFSMPPFSSILLQRQYLVL